ncbi:MAG: flagellar hook-length control protein FliK [Phycisphaerae bacterium]|nr:flagellar hook-length control protein FliK [Phycisphaerae bacterium]
MNGLIGTNLSAATVDKAAAGKKNAQGQLAKALFGNSVLNVGGKNAKPSKSDKISLIFGRQNSTKIAAAKNSFAEKLKKILAIPVADGMAVDLKVKQQDLQQISSASSVSAEKTLKNILPSKTVLGQAENSNAKLLSKHETLSAISKKSAAPLSNNTDNRPSLAKLQTIDKVIDKNNTKKIFENNKTGTNKSAGQPQKNTVIKPADTATKTVDIKTNPVETVKNIGLTGSDIKNGNLNQFSQAAAAKNSTPVRANQTEAKNQNTLFAQNSGLKPNIPQKQTNDKNSSQMPFKQGLAHKDVFTNINQKTQTAQNISFDDKKSNNFQSLAIGDVKSGAAPENISSSSGVDFENDLQAASKEISRQVADSISSAANNDTKQITIRLNPPELGRVVIKVSQQNSHIDAVLEASRPETKEQLQQAFSQVAKNLADSGITLRQFEVRSAAQSRSGFDSAFAQSNQPQNGSGEQYFQKQYSSDSFFNKPGQALNIKNLSLEENFSYNHFSAKSVNMLA